MKKVLQIVLAVVIIVLGYVMAMQIIRPLRFDKEYTRREAAVIERIKDIRSAERGYKQKYQEYASNFDQLIQFVLNDSLTYERSFGSKDDTLSNFRTESFQIAAIDTVFGARKLTPDAVRQLKFIPYADGKEYILNATILETESKVNVPVFECKAPYSYFLSDLNQQLLVNLVDERKSLNRYPGIKVGSLESATNDAGNWE